MCREMADEHREMAEAVADEGRGLTGDEQDFIESLLDRDDSLSESEADRLDRIHRRSV